LIFSNREVEEDYSYEEINKEEGTEVYDNRYIKENIYILIVVWTIFIDVAIHKMVYIVIPTFQCRE
jgi:hypothetical protein